MAKRKRLTPANPAVFGGADPAPNGLSRAPIADVAMEAATTSALEEVSRELAEARENGRMVLSLPLEQIKLDHLVRDRLMADDVELEALVESISIRGQQTPIEVMALDSGGYGLISGWRRCQAIARLVERGGQDNHVLALLRQPSEASDAYLAMVEENEIRVGLSYFERARIAVKSVDQGVFETEKAALLSLFRSASRPKRSKIRSFLPLVAAFDGVLRFPHMIGERLGLRLSSALEASPWLASDIREKLSADPPVTGEDEQAFLTTVLAKHEAQQEQSLAGRLETEKTANYQQDLRPGLRVEWQDESDTVTLSGSEMTPAFRAHLFEWLKKTRVTN